MVCLFFYHRFTLKEKQRLYLYFFNEEYFAPDGVIKKPPLNLTDIFPDLRC